MTTPIYNETLLAHEVDMLDLTGPDVEMLPRYPFASCDGHAEPIIQALFRITLASERELLLCGNCAARQGFALHQNMPTWLREENRTQGSDS